MVFRLLGTGLLLALLIFRTIWIKSRRFPGLQRYLIMAAGSFLAAACFLLAYLFTEKPILFELILSVLVFVFSAIYFLAYFGLRYLQSRNLRRLQSEITILDKWITHFRRLIRFTRIGENDEIFKTFGPKDP